VALLSVVGLFENLFFQNLFFGARENFSDFCRGKPVTMNLKDKPCVVETSAGKSTRLKLAAAIKLHKLSLSQNNAPFKPVAKPIVSKVRKTVSINRIQAGMSPSGLSRRHSPRRKGDSHVTPPPHTPKSPSKICGHQIRSDGPPAECDTTEHTPDYTNNPFSLKHEAEPAEPAKHEQTPPVDVLNKSVEVSFFQNVTELLGPHIDRLSVKVADISANLREALLPEQHREAAYERTAGGVDEVMMKVRHTRFLLKTISIGVLDDVVRPPRWLGAEIARVRSNIMRHGRPFSDQPILFYDVTKHAKGNGKGQTTRPTGRLVCSTDEGRGRGSRGEVAGRAGRPGACRRSRKRGERVQSIVVHATDRLRGFACNSKEEKVQETTFLLSHPKKNVRETAASS
jgi:hypothetical protein